MATKPCPGCGLPADQVTAGHRCDGYPYLGPVPPPSLPYGLAMKFSCAAFAAVALARAGFYVQRAGLDRRWARGEDVTGAIRANVSTLTRMSTLTLVAAVAWLALDLAWRAHRRPRQTLKQWGEACVESPMRCAVPLRVRLLAVGPILLFFIGLLQGTITKTTPPSDFASAWMWLAVAYVCLALGWMTVIAWVYAAERHVQSRRERSAAQREAPWTVGYIPPARTSGLAGDPASEGPMWILTTAGLAMVAIVGLVLVIGGLSGLSSDPGPATVGLGIGLALVGVVVWRVRLRRARKSAGAAEVGGP